MCGNGNALKLLSSVLGAIGGEDTNSQECLRNRHHDYDTRARMGGFHIYNQGKQ